MNPEVETALAKLTDAELEELFLEAERNALQWSELAIGIHADHRAVRWMEIAASYQTEIARRARNPTPKPGPPKPGPKSGPKPGPPKRKKRRA